ncbi:Dolichyl-phosphate-mannose--protein mannosyltransferase 2 [Astathelohania contejeani]|uniref:Dolichyl-phosphate-mannose--protein mannosyltransferase n=1 Tax=Astathelohania contejeani TaxID=164912 RepID=A0ABQ7I2J1_9MICR|nr:Dolichyl-phosphate-mannose--protein mannosyltransferase 2 [Thelohania contejeani]
MKSDSKKMNIKSYKTYFNISIIILIFLLTFIIRTYKIEYGNFVIWDEAHFGKFSSKYLNREFYFDVHPPLGKLMTALSGWLFDQDLAFKFESASTYPENMDYVGMRRFHAFIASFVTVFAYLILQELEYSMKMCVFTCLLLIFENGMVSISRLILLDSHLLFFTSLVTYLMVKSYKRNNYYQSNIKNQILNLLLLGISLGCVLSVKWIGCLTTLYVGILTIYELWNTLTSKTGLQKFISMFLLRVVFLIIVPIIVYFGWFKIHFAIVNHTSSDESYMSSLFQSNLKGSTLDRVRKYVPYGRPISLKSQRMAGGNLHSHPHVYPGTKANQVTQYHHKDDNNNWAFQKVIDGVDPIGIIMDNDEVVLLHLPTRRYLAISEEESFMTDETRIECTDGGLTRDNLWKVEIVDDIISKEECVKTMTTRFRLRSVDGKCYLRSTGETYPPWGFSQGEITCSIIKDESTLWNIENNPFDETEENSRKNIEYKEIRNLKSTFISDLFEINKAMFIVNKSFVQDKDLEPARITSKPLQWLFLERGLRMTSWDDSSAKFYMFGNPLIWYLSSLCVILSPIILLGKTVIFLRRGFHVDVLKMEFLKVFVFSGGWFLHYLPFFFVGRVLYFHHYFPALFFAILSICYVFNHFSPRFLKIFVLLSIFTFIFFSPLCYGFKGPASQYSNRQWIESWDIYG